MPLPSGAQFHPFCEALVDAYKYETLGEPLRLRWVGTRWVRRRESSAARQGGRNSSLFDRLLESLLRFRGLSPLAAALLAQRIWFTKSCYKHSIRAMEVYGKSMIAEPSNVIYLSSILNRDGPIPSHKCDMRCQNEHVFGNIYRCKLTGLTHICDKNCNQRILYDNHSSLCRVSGQLFPLSPVEEQAVRGVRRKFEMENSDGCAFKRRRDAQLHPSPFERSFSAIAPICSQVGEGTDMS